MTLNQGEAMNQKSVDNIKKFQAISINVLFPVLLVYLYFDEAYFVLLIYILFITWYALSEISIYKKLFNNNGKGYVIKTLALLFVNTLFTLLTRVYDSDVWLYLCVGGIVYSAWFGYFESRTYYLNNKEGIDYYFQKESESL